MLLIGFGHKARQGKNTAAVAVLNAMAPCLPLRLAPDYEVEAGLVGNQNFVTFVILREYARYVILYT